MKKTVEEKAELAKIKIDKKLQKQQQKAEKAEAKKEAATEKKAAKKELQQQRKAAKKEIASAKKETQKELAEQKKAAKKEAAERKKNAKQEAASKIKALKNDAKQGKIASGEKAETTKAKGKDKPIKKEKIKKGKPSPKGKGKNKSEESSGGSKKKLFAGVLALVFVCAGIVGFLHFRGGNKEEEKDPYIEAYVLDDDFVTSIPKFLGESEKRALPEITEEENNGSKRIIYNYTELKDAEDEVRDYINFLTGEQEFVPMFDYNLEAPGGYVSVGTASQEEGKILKIDIDYTDTDYKVMVSKTSEKLPEPKDDSDKIDISRDGALSYLSSFSAEKLGLPKPIEEYKAIYDNGQTSIGNHNCYGISLYEIGRAGTNVFQGKYFVATNQSAIYRYDVEEDTYVEIEDSTLPPKAKETLQETAAQLNEAEEGNSDGEEQSNSSEEENDKENNEKDKEDKKEDEEDKKDKKENKTQKGRKADREENQEETEE